MLNYIDFNGEQTPILFGNAAFYNYEKKNGTSAFADFVASSPVDESGNFDYTKLKIAFYVDIAHAAFLAGGVKVKKPFAFDVSDVAEWLDFDRLPEIIDLFVDAMPKPKAEGEAIAAK